MLDDETSSDDRSNMNTECSKEQRATDHADLTSDFEDLKSKDTKPTFNYHAGRNPAITVSEAITMTFGQPLVRRNPSINS